MNTPTLTHTEREHQTNLIEIKYATVLLYFRFHFIFVLESMGAQQEIITIKI